MRMGGNMGIKCAWIIGLLIQMVMAEALIDISASVNQNKVYKNQPIVLTLTVSGVDIDHYKEINLPDVSAMFSIQSTSQSSSLSSINGVVSRKKQFRYVLMPKKSGVFIIDPVTIQSKSDTFSTQPIRVVVREETTPSTQSASKPNTIPPMRSAVQLSAKKKAQMPSVFLEASVSTHNILLGDTITYSVKLYRRVSLWSSITIDQEDVPNAWQDTLETAPERVVQKNNHRFYELELLRRRIQPLSAGEQMIPPLTARFIMDPFSGERQLASLPITINVHALPTPMPQAFTGAIGAFDMQVYTPNQTPVTDSFQLKIIISGVGNLNQMRPPIIKDTTEFRAIVSPDSTANIQSNTRAFDYIIIPKISGEITVPNVEFSYLDRHTMTYHTVTSNPISFESIIPPSATISSSPIVSNDIEYLMKNGWSVSIISGLSSLQLRQYLIGFVLTGVTIWLIMVVNPWRLIRSSHTHVSKKTIQRDMARLSDAWTIQQMEQLLLDTLMVYTNYPSSHLISREVLHALQQAGVGDAIISGAIQWLKSSQQAQFSNQQESINMHSAADSLKRILLAITTKGAH